MNANSRIAAAIVAYGEFLEGTPEGAHDEARRAAILEAVNNGDPDVQPLAKLILAVVSAYFAAGDLDLEVTARDLIERVARGNKATIYQLSSTDFGDWEAVIRRTRETAPTKPVIILPGMKDWN